MIETVDRIYKKHGIDLLKQTWVVPPSEWSGLAQRSLEQHRRAAEEILDLHAPELRNYWKAIDAPLTRVFLDQLKINGGEFKNWGVHLPVAPYHLETVSIAVLAAAKTRQEALLAIEINNIEVARRHKKGQTVVLAVDGAVWDSAIGVELNVGVRDGTNQWKRDMVDSFIAESLNRRYKVSSKSNNMRLVWLAGIGWNRISANSINMGHDRTAIFTNLFKALPRAEMLCRKFGWEYPGDESVREALIGIYVGHENSHEIRATAFSILDELSADLMTLSCNTEMVIKKPFGSIEAYGLVLATLAEYGAQAKEKPVGHEIVDGYELSGRIIINLMLNSELLSFNEGAPKLDLTKIENFYRTLMESEEQFAKGGSVDEVLSRLPSGALPQQLLDML